MATTFEKIQHIIAEQLEIDAATISLETHFKNDLSADSIDVFQIINDIEDTFDTYIETEDDIQTVSDLVVYVENKMK